eukprot:scaffold71136_cov67-Phaeocystis_antarctica.AAC.7
MVSESRATESRASRPPACVLQKRSSGGPGGRISVLLKRSSGVLGALGRISSGALEPTMPRHARRMLGARIVRLGVKRRDSAR